MSRALEMATDLDTALDECSLCGRLTRSLALHIARPECCRPRDHRYHDHRGAPR